MEKTVDEIIAKMTLHEKVMFCMGKNFWKTKDYEHLGIPSIVMSDGTSGVRFQKGSDTAEVEKISFYESLSSKFDDEAAIDNTHEATCFPSGSSIACSWNKDLVHQMGIAIAHECQKLGINLLLGPGMNIRRHPLTARNFEYYSEDPCLTAEMASALVEAVQSQGVGTCIKHFACHNSDSRRTRVNAIVNERALHEIYLSAYEKVVKKAKPTCIMTSYNQINGIEASGNTPLINDLLRTEWGFNGAAICDWGAVKDVAEATRGGVDLQMPFSLSSAKRLEEAVLSGELKEELVDRRVKNLLRLVFQLKEKEVKRESVNYEKHHEIARMAAEESITLLKNQGNILPIKDTEIKKLAVVGRLAKTPLYQGTGCAIVHSKKVDIPLEYIEVCCKNKIKLSYAEGYLADGSVSEDSLEEALSIAQDADAVIVFAGAKLPEEDDDYNRKNMNMEEGHEQIVHQIEKINKNMIVVLANGDSVLMPWVHKVKAILDVWYSGEGMGKALADILFGNVNPSGKLAATIPAKLSDTPSYLGFPGDSYHLEYNEGIYVGYRYYDKKEISPLFEFGYGLSYTSFEYRKIGISKDCIEFPGNVKVSVEIRNTGEYYGKEIVQLYVSEADPKLPRAKRDLKAFEKIALLPGETKQVEFVLEERDFCHYNDELSEWQADSGMYIIEVGASSRDIRLSSPVMIKSIIKPYPVLKKDCGFYEMFASQAGTEIFLNFLVEHNMVTKEQANEELIRKLKGTFWPVRVFMDMNSRGMVTYEKVDQIIDEINRKLCQS